MTYSIAHDWILFFIYRKKDGVAAKTLLRHQYNLHYLFQDQIKQQESKVASSKVDPVRKANLESVLADAEEKFEKAKRDSGEVSVFLYNNYQSGAQYTNVLQ